MGTIADLLGSQLPDDWQKSEAVTDEPSPDEEPQPGPDAIVVEIVLDETGFPPEEMRPELELGGELGLTGLALWSVVSRIEREVGRTFPDVEVESWRTLGDILGAAAGRSQ